MVDSSLFQMEIEDSMLDFDFRSINKYLRIKINVVKDNFWKERKRYNSANLDQRAVIDFKIVDNAIDNMKEEVVKDDNGNETNLSDYELNKIKVKIIDSMNGL